MDDTKIGPRLTSTECVKMQAIDLAQKVMDMFEGVPSVVSINAMDICRVLIKEKDFNAISSRPFLPESLREISQFERELKSVPAETASCG
jgi:hypothetical protein